MEATQALRGAVQVAKAWISGSFVSSNEEPNDIDVVYVIEADHLDSVGPQAAGLIGLFMGGDKLKSRGYLIDAFILAWRLNPESAPRGSQDRQYAFYRGYWDDLWQRIRHTPKAQPGVRDDALPRRGYLEVMLDGF